MIKRYSFVAVIVIVVFVVYFFFIRRRDDEKQVIADRIKVASWYDYLKKVSKDYNIPFRRIASIVAVESGGVSGLRGSSGEYGLMQITPIAHEDVKNQWGQNSMLPQGYPDFTLGLNDGYNILVGTAYLAILKERNNGNLDQATKRYNGINESMTTQYLQKVKEFEKYF